MRKYLNLFIVFLSLNFLFSTQVLSVDCTAVSGTTVTITTSCSELSIGGDGPNVTINSGVTINGAGTDSAVSAGGNATITNNGRIETTGIRSFRTSGGQVDELINNGTITAEGTEGIRNGGTITILTNTDEISAGTK